MASLLLSACGEGSDGRDGTVGATGSPGANGADGINAANGHLQQIGRYDSGLFDAGGAEIVAFDNSTNKLFVVNSGANTIDVVDITNPSQPNKLTTLVVADQDSASFISGGANSVAVKNGWLAVAVEADSKQDSGRIYVYNTGDHSFAAAFTTGALPDMVTFSHDGQYLLSANEGEPNSDYSNDPEGSITVVDLSAGVSSAIVNQATFTNFNAHLVDLVDDGVRITGPGASVAMDIEPEYIAVSLDNQTAYVTLQENNALALVDIATATVTHIVPLGYKDHSLQGMGFDGNKNDDFPNIMNQPIFGMYMPDSIAAYSFNGKTYLITANEGDGREYIYAADSATCTGAGHTDLGDDECLAYADEVALEDLNLDTSVFTADQIAELQDGKGWGDLTVTNATGDADRDGHFEKIYAFGARSFSIWNAEGEMVFDSGDQMEQIIADQSPLFFNVSNDKNSTDNRSDNKGPEPEGVAIGTVSGRTYAFIGLERQGGIMVFDVSNPFAPSFVEYTSNRDLSIAPEEGVDAGDLGPEGLVFVSAEDSPNGEALLIVGNEVSGTTTIYQVQ
ncbi:choice-of-anchor I family protein [Simiduia litorea]|uniref:choice-of-anchor I family protein n=1 Tax=Simiduia litorea TaxID=1435348 RepID=UPI0036F26D80